MQGPIKLLLSSADFLSPENMSFSFVQCSLYSVCHVYIRDIKVGREEGMQKKKQ
jgi:hypothetical protein